LFDDKQKLGERLYKETWAGTKARESMLRRFNLKNVTKEWEDVIIEYIHKHRNKMSDRTIEMVEI
jgi:hypothetical protein